MNEFNLELHGRNDLWCSARAACMLQGGHAGLVGVDVCGIIDFPLNVSQQWVICLSGGNVRSVYTRGPCHLAPGFSPPLVFPSLLTVGTSKIFGGDDEED